MKRNVVVFTFLALISGLVLSACGAVAADKAAAQSLAPVVSNSSQTSEGRLAPSDFRYLSFGMGGKVAEILVKKGDQVSAGQVLARLGNREQGEAALAGAWLEQASAQQAYNDLTRTPALAHAAAWLAVLDAKDGTLAAGRAWDAVNSTAFQSKLDDAEKAIKTKNDVLKTAQDAFDKVKNLPADDPSYKSANDKLIDAQQAYDDAVRQRDALLNQRERAKAGVQQAQDALAEVQHKYDTTQNGADAEQLTLLQARLAAAQAQVTAAQSALDNLELKSPLAGTVVDINVVTGELANPANWAVLVADYSQWYVETKDLTEMDVVKVSVGQMVEMAPDSLPDVKLTGKVTQISDVPQVINGDVTYKVRILLDSAPDAASRLRWGMTLQVTFAK
jgi:HlyD family secretion protein